MSENIQSIANGTYSIGETNKLTFSAGPGIKIDEPSAGTVRIGEDRTVLFSGNASTANMPVSLSESVLNFEYYEVNCIGWSYGSSGEGLQKYRASNGYPTMINYAVNAAGTDNRICRILMDTTTDKAKLNLLKCELTTANNATAFSDNKNAFRLFSVIGINRISGSNA